LPRTAEKPTYAALVAKLAKAKKQARDGASRKVTKRIKAAPPEFAETDGMPEKYAAAFERCVQLQSQINAIEAAERQQHRQHFQKSDEEKARLLLFGWRDGGLKAITRHRFPPPGSFLEHVCLWSLWKVLHGRIEQPGSLPKEMPERISAVLKDGETQRDFVRLAVAKELRYREGSAPSDILRQLASLFVPNGDHGLAHPKWVARISQQSAGQVANVYAVRSSPQWSRSRPRDLGGKEP
jgi:hypothetical protein